MILAASHPEILATIVQLLKKLSKETPEIFSDGDITITGPILFKLIPLLPDIMPKKQINNDFLDVIKNLIWLIYSHNMSAFLCFFKDLLLFLQGTFSLSSLQLNISYRFSPTSLLFPL
jgi:predicted thioredoxin/glutaredoxin